MPFNAAFNTNSEDFINIITLIVLFLQVHVLKLPNVMTRPAMLSKRQQMHTTVLMRILLIPPKNS